VEEEEDVRAKDGRELFLLGCAAEAKYDAGLKDRLAIAATSPVRGTQPAAIKEGRGLGAS
jgi:hypothetical protein